MTNQAKNPIRPANNAPLDDITIIRDNRVLTLTVDPMTIPMSVQPTPARRANLNASGSMSGETAERFGDDRTRKRRITLAAIAPKPAVSIMIERVLDTATKDN
jgi:hypothetical protein